MDIQRATVEAGAPYRIRIGVHAGDVVKTETDVMGFAVNKAARVASAASGGEIVVSSVVKELVGFDPGYSFGESFYAELRGIEKAPMNSCRCSGRRPRTLARCTSNVCGESWAPQRGLALPWLGSSAPLSTQL